ncbi:MAG: arginine--tRNA ligase [Candidatus Shapirobacteria bacterium]
MQTDIVKQLTEIVSQTISSMGYKIDSDEIIFEHPADSNFGDYSTNIGMILGKREKKNPKVLAQEILVKISAFSQESGLIEKAEVAGNGFINIFLKNEVLLRQAEVINYEIEFRNKLNAYGKGKTVVVDYSAPNIAKPFGIGHLRSTNIGQAIYNIYKFLGWNCIGDNHLGDWGTQFGKLIVAVKKWGKKTVDNMTVDDLEKLYVKFHEEEEKEPGLIEEAREWFSKLENGDSEAKSIWQKCVDISLLEFDRVYDLLGVKIDFAYGESFYLPMLEDVINDCIKKGITRKSEGALIIEFENMPPIILKKTNEATTYLARDLAAIKYRKETWNPDLIVYEVGSDQNLYFRQVFAVAKMLGWMPKDGFKHIGHGLIRWKDGKFSTRKGQTIHLSEVIYRAKEMATAVAEKSSVSKEMTSTEKQEMIQEVAIGAIKFNDLSSDPRKDVIFDWDKIMSLDGDSGPYLQYTYARCQSVLAKTRILEQKNIDSVPLSINEDELQLLREFYKFEEKIIESSCRFSPAVVAEYILSVARKFNEFYGKNRIVESKEEAFRVFLTKTTASIIRIGLVLLGLKPIEKM